MVFLFAVSFVFLFFFVLRLYSILLFTGDFYLSALYQLKYVKYNASVGNTGHFDEVTDLAFSTLLVTGCVPQYVLRSINWDGLLEEDPIANLVVHPIYH